MSSFQQPDIILLDLDGEPALSPLLQRIGVTVLRLPLDLPVEIAAALHRQQPERFLLVSGHGDDNGIILSQLDDEIAATQPFNQRLTPEIITKYAVVTGMIVISTACASGSPAMVSAWLEAGATDVIAPSGYVNSVDALVFTTHLFWLLSRQQLELNQAVHKASSLGGETDQFELHQVVQI